ncbi:hypothetical protein BBJ28_00003485 [Nothophytophthora sp. Chile5]|nr:hypothetical protein BBJ28_00003485 [Nothophytophthora sp. Chile5]
MVEGAVDVVAQLYRLQHQSTDGSGDGEAVATSIVLANVPETLLARLTERSVRWDALSGFLQRALLWDLGLVGTRDGRLIQVFVPCGDTMSSTFLTSDVFDATRCPLASCSNTSLQFASAACESATVHHVAQCAIAEVEQNASDISDATPTTLWSEDGDFSSVPNIRLFKHWGDEQTGAVGDGEPSQGSSQSGAVTNSISNGSSNDVLFTINQKAAMQLSADHCPLQGFFTTPCTQRHDGNAELWCPPTRGGFVDLWLDSEMAGTTIVSSNSQASAIAMSKDSTTSISGSTIALVVLFIVLAGAAGAIIAICVSCRKRDQKHITASPTIYECALTMRSRGRGDEQAHSPNAQRSPHAKLSPRNSLSESRRRRSVELAAFCADAKIASKRIAYDCLVFEKMLARGASGEVWRATFGSQVVAIKQLLPEKRQDEEIVARFAQEVRLAAALEHPNIVRFVGLSWNRVCDMCIVSEFMEQGDLSMLLNSKRNSELTWAKEKLAIALDIAEALAYLHGRQPAIIHRDLKSLNVLLDTSLRAKLSDFGLSRERSFDDTMTNGVGTLLWTAPEILRGEPYSERADVYSYAIVLSELDTCLPPFTLNEEVSERHLTTMQLMHLATSGEVSPQLRDDCPASLQHLTAACAAFEPAQRPTALEIVFTLRNISRCMRYD